LPKEKVLAWLREELSGSEPKVFTNALYDIGFLEAAGIHVAGSLMLDICVAEPLLDENRFTYSLDALSKHYLGVGKDDKELDEYLVAHFGRKNPKSNIWRAPPSVVAPYAEGDVDRPLRVFPKQRTELIKQGLWDLFVLESKLIPILFAMRKRGIRIDVKEVHRMHDRVTGQMKVLQCEIGDGVSVWSAADLAQIYDRAGVEYPFTPKTKKPSFTAQFFERSDHPLSKKIHELRKLDKLRGTFLESSILGSLVGDRIHCQFNQLKSDKSGSVSGRLSSSQPNLQFIPTRTEMGKEMRAMFLPDRGQRFWSMDYSQIEYRLIAHDAATLGLRGADAVVEAYRRDSGTDFHQVVADMTGVDRSKAKTINFGVAYGEGLDKLCKSLGLSRSDGEAFMAEYHRRAPFLRPLSQGSTRQAAQTGLITTLLGRRRRFDTWETTNWRTGENKFFPHRVASARRAFTHAALNARIQGSAADIMKKSMVDVWESGVCDVLGPPQLTVHDELDGSAPKTRAGNEALRETKAIMERTVELLVPLKVDMGTGKNWREAKE